jgi:hypothetical protein
MIHFRQKNEAVVVSYETPTNKERYNENKIDITKCNQFLTLLSHLA